MPTVDRTALLTQLPSQVKSVNDALVELCKVLTNNTFDVAQIWGATAQSDIRAYLNGLTIQTGISDAVTTIKGSSAGAAVVSGMDAVMNGLHDVIEKINTTVESAANPDVLTALQNLLHSHAANSYGAAPYGLFPAIAGVITAGGGNANALTGPLNDVADAGSKVTAMLAFSDFAEGTFGMLHKAFNPA